MAIALDVATAGGSTTATTLSWSHTTSGSNRALWVVAYDRIAATTSITGVTYNGVAMTSVLAGGIQVPGDRVVTLWYLANPALGANTVTISLASGFIAGNSVSYTGVKQTGQPEVTTSSTASATTSITGNVTTISDNSWVIMGVKANGATAGSGTGGTQRITTNGATLVDSNGAITPPASTNIGSNGGATANWAEIAVAMAPFVATPTGSGFFGLM